MKKTGLRSVDIKRCDYHLFVSKNQSIIFIIMLRDLGNKFMATSRIDVKVFYRIIPFILPPSSGNEHA